MLDPGESPCPDPMVAILSFLPRPSVACARDDYPCLTFQQPPNRAADVYNTAQYTSVHVVYGGKIVKSKNCMKSLKIAEVAEQHQAQESVDDIYLLYEKASPRKMIDL